MKQIFTTLAALCSVYSLMAFNVTFRVDMNNEMNFTTPEVNGSFNNWCGNCAAMTDANSDGIWEITIDLAAGNYEYKFSHDNWGGQEQLVEGSSCTVTNFGFTNRSLVVAGNVTLPIVCYGACTTCDQVLPSYPITFRVDMNGVTGFTTPEINGTFNNWCGGCAPMSDTDGDGIYEITITLQQATYEYKFAYDNWNGQESLAPGSSCTITTDVFTNRQITVTAPATLDAVCWGSCTPCAVVTPNYDVTFRVDMNGQTGFTTPEVNGTFNSWCGNCNPMSDSDGDGIWEVTLSIPEGTHEFKYAYDNWAGQESLMSGMPCTVTNDGFTNRSLEVTGDMIMDVVCWESCNACNVIVDTYDVVFRVDMNGVTGFTTPEVSGTFNNWCSGCAPMSDTDGDGIWELTIALEPGTYEYKFAYDSWAGSEQLTEGLPCTVTNGGFTNRSLVVNGPADLGTVCWASCTACEQEVVTYDVIFRVDMNGVSGFTTPEVNGTFNDWCGGCAPMSDTDGDGIWELTIALEAGSYEFKYAYDSWAGSEQLADGLPCTVNNGGFVNRSLVVEGPTDLGTVCWASCGPCGSGNTFNVTFRVDMNEVTDAFTTPEVNGTFNNWCGGCAPMSDTDGDNVWVLTIPLAPGTYEFKYAYDSWLGQESLAPGSTCVLTTGQFTNRVITVAEDMDLGVVCWSSCTSCDNPSGPFNVTFKLNMAEYTGTFTTPEVNGTFNSWCGACAPMSDADADNVWEITIALPAGTHEYKFSHDNWTGQEALVAGSSCTVTVEGFTNRTVTVTEAMVMDAVCWGECVDCDTYVIENQTESIVVYPNPANNQVNVQLSAQTQMTTIRLYSVTGQIVFEKTMAANGTQTIDTAAMADGMYELEITTAEGSARRKVMVRH